MGSMIDRQQLYMTHAGAIEAARAKWSAQVCEPLRENAYADLSRVLPGWPNRRRDAGDNDQTVSRF